jgi:AcrR family transcriptional regulator
MNKQDERQRILDVATSRFTEAGITKVTIDEVASELQMSKKTVYKFFPSKEDLLRTVVKMMLMHVEREFMAIVNSDEPFEQKLTLLFALVGRQVRKLSRQFQLDMQRFAPGLWKEIDTFRRERVLSRLKNMLLQAKQEKIFRNDVDIDLFYLVLLNAVQGVVNPKVLSENSFSAEEAFHGIVGILFKGALTEDAIKRFDLFDFHFE